MSGGTWEYKQDEIREIITNLKRRIDGEAFDNIQEHMKETVEVATLAADMIDVVDKYLMDDIGSGSLEFRWDTEEFDRRMQRLGKGGGAV